LKLKVLRAIRLFESPAVRKQAVRKFARSRRSLSKPPAARCRSPQLVSGAAFTPPEPACGAPRTKRKRQPGLPLFYQVHGNRRESDESGGQLELRRRNRS
jgi:hypothetical protein